MVTGKSFPFMWPAAGLCGEDMIYSSSFDFPYFFFRSNKFHFTRLSIHVGLLLISDRLIYFLQNAIINSSMLNFY